MQPQIAGKINVRLLNPTAEGAFFRADSRGSQILNTTEFSGLAKRKRQLDRHLHGTGWPARVPGLNVHCWIKLGARVSLWSPELWDLRASRGPAPWHATAKRAPRTHDGFTAPAGAALPWPEGHACYRFGPYLAQRIRIVLFGVPVHNARAPRRLHRLCGVFWRERGPIRRSAEGATPRDGRAAGL